MYKFVTTQWKCLQTNVYTLTHIEVCNGIDFLGLILTPHYFVLQRTMLSEITK